TGLKTEHPEGASPPGSRVYPACLCRPALQGRPDRGRTSEVVADDHGSREGTTVANPRALVKRRKAVRNIKKITRTMELIATARYRRAMDRATHASAYVRKIAEMVADLSATAADVSHPLLVKREKISNSLLLVLASNRGLCGGYNAGILREAAAAVRAA